MPDRVLSLPGLDPCVHCGFCLPACPTYRATGDETESPRGRIVLMRAFAEGRLDPDADALAPLDRCLGCRGCEPACPSGVAYGESLTATRAWQVARRGLPLRTRLALAIFGSPPLLRLFGAGARGVRATVAMRLAGRRGIGRLLAQVAATAPATPGGRSNRSPPLGHRGRVLLFRGCVMDALFSHVHAATARVLEANGYEVRAVAAGCCGALHEHAGDRTGARRMAQAIVTRLHDLDADAVVVNSAGCGAHLKAYGHLLATSEAHALANRTVDIMEWLARGALAPPGPLPLRAAYDPPCHLQHAQGVHDEVLRVLKAIPDLALHLLPGAEQCCGGAGLYTLLEPRLSAAVLDAKVGPLLAATPPIDVVITGNPGCLMQIGGGLAGRRSRIRAVHPVEVLDRAYSHYPSPDA